MPEQLSLTDIPAEEKPTDRLFYGIFPDSPIPPAITRIGQRLRADHDLTGKLLLPERFHITLVLLDDYYGLPTGVVRTALEAAATVKAAPFEVQFDRAASFAGKPGNNPLVLRGNGLTALHAFQAALCSALKRHGVAYRGSTQYIPHVTVLYDAKMVAEVPVEPVRWIVREFVLVHSRLRKTQHLPLGRWPLR